MLTSQISLVLNEVGPLCCSVLANVIWLSVSLIGYKRRRAVVVVSCQYVNLTSQNHKLDLSSMPESLPVLFYIDIFISIYQFSLASNTSLASEAC